MKKIQLSDRKAIVLQTIIFIGILLFFSFILQGCNDTCTTTTQYTYFEAVYKTTQEIRDEFGVKPPRNLETPGKIYVFGDYLLVNEVEKGIHVIYNPDCQSPQPIVFINIPGNFDLAVKDYILYADSYVDLLAIDISDVNNIRLLKRLESVFPDHYAPLMNATGDQLIVEYVEKERIEINEDDCRRVPLIHTMERGLAVPDANLASFSQTAGSPVQGIGGSMARFTVYQDFLYAVDSYSMHVIDIEQGDQPEKINHINMGRGIETIFPYQDKLFIGANNGMHIYDNAVPTEPRHLSTFEHVRTCDPVVVNDSIAYVTLRSDNDFCAGFTNQLDVLDIRNLLKPTLIKSFPMQNPHGLGIDGNLLFITEGDFGFKVFDATYTSTIDQHLVFENTDIHGFDVIPFNNILILIGEDGLYQFNYSDPKQIEFCSVIPIINPNL